MSKSSNSSVASSTQPAARGHKVVAGVVVGLVVLVVFVLLAAFVWPGWATNKGSQVPGGSTQTTAPAEPKNTKPTLAAKALPADATDLLKAMPDTVQAYSRQAIENSKTWADTSPLEEYTVTYSTGKASEDIKLTVAQWSQTSAAATKYTALTGALTGEKLGSGNVKVSGKQTGSYQVHQDADDSKQAIAIWQNDTCVFQVTGPTAAVKAFYQAFPL